MKTILESSLNALRHELHRYDALTDQLEAKQEALWAKRPWNKEDQDLFINVFDSLQSLVSLRANLNGAIYNLETALRLSAKVNSNVVCSCQEN